MATLRRRWRGLACVIIVLVSATGGWYAHQQGWLTALYALIPAGAGSEGAPAGGSAGHAGHGGAMSSAAMATASPSGHDMSSSVPGHARVMIAPSLQQRIGVRVGYVERGPLHMSVRALGIVRPDETREARVSIKTQGWVEELFVNFVGQEVREGDPLLAIYSPEFLSTQQEFLDALQAARSTASLGTRPWLADAARRRLQLWDVPEEALEQLERTGKPQQDLVLRSPIGGTVLEKNVLERDYVTPEKQLYRIADLSMVWVQAKVYEYEVPHVELGQPATVTVTAFPERQFQGKVVFIQPTVQETTRTVEVRVELPNQEGLLKPGMFAQSVIEHAMGEGLLVPTSAILHTGERDLAFLAEPDDHFAPVEVKISPIQFGDSYQVLEGLNEGDRVVISGNFLIDSESRLRLGGGAMAGMHHHGTQEPGPAAPAGDSEPAPADEHPVDHSSHEGHDMDMNMDMDMDMDMENMDHSQMDH